MMYGINFSSRLAEKIRRYVLLRMRCGSTNENVANLVVEEVRKENQTDENTWLLPVAISVPLCFCLTIALVVGEYFYL